MTFYDLQSSQFQCICLHNSLMCLARFLQSSETTQLNLYPYNLLNIPAFHNQDTSFTNLLQVLPTRSFFNFIIFQELFRCALILQMDATAGHSKTHCGWVAEGNKRCVTTTLQMSTQRQSSTARQSLARW